MRIQGFTRLGAVGVSLDKLIGINSVQGGYIIDLEALRKHNPELIRIEIVDHSIHDVYCAFCGCELAEDEKEVCDLCAPGVGL
jgi:hypothetical protein